MIGGCFLHGCVMTSASYRKNFDKINNNKAVSLKELYKGFLAMKNMALSIFFGQMMNFINIPGILFSSGPSEDYLSAGVWIVVANLTVGFSDTLGKAIGGTRFYAKVRKAHFWLMIGCNI